MRSPQLRVIAIFTLGLLVPLSTLTHAELVVSVQNIDGGNSLTVRPGEDFTLHLDVEDTVGDTPFDSFYVELLFSQPGLVLQGVDFPQSPPDRCPFLCPPPIILGTIAGMLSLEQAASVFGDRMHAGTLVVLDIHATETYPIGPVSIETHPDFFADGFVDRTVSAGETFFLNIVPEPLTVALLTLGAFVTLRRRDEWGRSSAVVMHNGETQHDA